MKKVQESPWLKGAAVVVLLASALLSGLFGSFVLRGLPYQIAGSWQYTDSFYRLLQERQAAAAAAPRFTQASAGEAAAWGSRMRTGSDTVCPTW